MLWLHTLYHTILFRDSFYEEVAIIILSFAITRMYMYKLYMYINILLTFF